jgi:diguanylate cyclase (GGDEF)-like protein
LEQGPPSRFVTRLWRVVAGLLVLISLLIGQSIYTSRQQHEEQAIVEASSVARILESDVRNLIEKVGVGLHTVAMERERQLDGRPCDQAVALAYIANVREALPDVLSLRVLDEEGLAVYRADLDAGSERIKEDQPLFKRLREGHDSRVAVSMPHLDLASGRWVVDLALRIEHSDGRYAGAVVAPVPVDTLVAMLGAADVGPGGMVALRGGESLELIARSPPVPDPTRKVVPPRVLRDLIAQGAMAGTYRAKSPADGVERLVAYRRVPGYPLHILVGRSTEEYLGHWQRDMGIVAALAASLFAVSIGATLMVDRAWRRQRRLAHLLETQAHTDMLTGLANRRHFFEVADAEVSRARRYDTPLSVLMLDIDHFKEVNDTHGHRAGDRVLQQVASTCLEVLRTVDVVGRVGGEEFAVLLPETGREGAIDVAERLREAVARAQVEREQGVPLRVTISIGVSARAGNVNLDTLMSQADAALYDAKHAGRNRVCAYEARS